MNKTKPNQTPFILKPNSSKYNEDGTEKHVICEGSRNHVVSYYGDGMHCNVKNCEVNRDRIRMNKELELKKAEEKRQARLARRRKGKAG